MKHPLLPPERAALRKCGLSFKALAEVAPDALAALCALPLERCVYLTAMAQFQSLVSVGPASAQDIWDLGCTSLAELATREPFDMYQALSLQVGQRLDPCVEDVFRCAIAQVIFPDLPAGRKDWWHWKEQRGAPMR
ncbi:helix-hairpin-helix domain-containing protein [Janthinobacterium sp.]|uniref:helix-hairpin-helix domain-containing protein n=1 Tax=Janthinobacterium sp. TaxID=1871054 RepID=UPI00293D6D14|nr:helix-hairpin-helix domain-containing protein [Janthinobacterium sp.]